MKNTRIATSTLPCAHGVSFGLVRADCSPEHYKALTDLNEAKRLMTLLLINGHHFSKGLQQEAQQFLNPSRYPKKPVEPGSVLAELITEWVK